MQKKRVLKFTIFHRACLQIIWGLMLLPILAYSQLTEQRIMEVPGSKKSFYMQEGIFQRASKAGEIHQLEAMRTHYSPSQGYERVVFDLTSKDFPGIYGHIDKDQNKVFIDFVGSKLNSALTQESGKAAKKSFFIKGIEIFELDSSRVSVELAFDKKLGFDVFYLKNPSRLVIDIQETSR